MARGSIRQRSKVRKDSWTVQVYLGLDPETGKKRYRSESVRGTRAQAQRRLTELLRELDTGTLARPSGVTVGEYPDEWLRDHAGLRVRNRTLEGYRDYVRRYLLPAIGRIPLDRLTPRDVRAMEVALLRSGGRGGAALSPRTVLQAHRILSSSLSNAVRIGLVPRNAAAAVEPPRVARYEAAILGWAEVHRFLSQVTEPLFHTLFLLAVQTGLRRSELLGLQWRDVDLSTGALSVQRALIKIPSGGVELAVPKTGRGRVVALPPESVEALSVHLARQHENGSFVFCGSDGTPLDPDLVTQSFKRMDRKVGLEHIRLHDLRHTHASLMLAEGVHLKVISERLGHSSIGITGDIYSHVQPTVQREAVERFGVAWRVGMAKECQIGPESV